MREKRSLDKRRWGLYPEFPLMDSRGAIITRNRRRIEDRRVDSDSFEDRLLMLAEMPPPHSTTSRG